MTVLIEILWVLLATLIALPVFLAAIGVLIIGTSILILFWIINDFVSLVKFIYIEVLKRDEW